ncbi:MAG TPA: hypothetical protein VF591_21575 [Pyrinomonadaceae bacterium]|jgi:hypothetical protein
MSVRKTESRLPENFQPHDLGQAVEAGDGRCKLISFITSPLAVNRDNVYVLFVTDGALAAAAQSFEWSFAENGGAPNIQSTQHGEVAYRPQAVGSLDVVVRVLGAGNSEQARVTLEQEAVPLNAELEGLINAAGDEPGPGIAAPEVARELVNDHNPYYQSLEPRTPESGDAFKRFVFGLVFQGVLERTSARRKQHLEQLAASLNGQGTDFGTLAAEGAGVCGIRLALLAMTLPQTPSSPAALLDWTELPEQPASQRAFADEQLRQRLAALNENTRLDLFNLARFPKSNITQCGRIVEGLRDRYFAGTNFNDVLTGMAGTRAVRITTHYRQGPLTRT